MSLNESMAKINRTNITLIPKTKNPTKITEFRLISLSNVIYKLISKVLANRLKSILPQIITENQSAFLSERLITNNVLAAFELMHFLEHKKEGKDCFMAVKLDISKAYDRVEWGFIKKVMKQLGFNERWISLIMHCITTVTYSVLINGVSHRCIVPLRGLRQGDPLSPYLFLICVDGFSSLINDAVRYNMLSGVSICRGSPMVTHLFFTDDSLLFCKASIQECQKLIAILDLYEAASEQKINVDKSSISFSQNTPPELKAEVLEVMGPMKDLKHYKYLGLTSIIGKSKIDVFAELKEQVARKLSRWKEKLLSMGGREILIKVVVQAIPTYSMSYFLLPKSLFDEIEGMMRRFWWGQRKQESRIAWINWKKLCKSKLKGGIGFRNLQAFNLAMLAKQGWRFLSNPQSLIA